MDFDFKNYEKVSIKLNSSFINKTIKPEKNPIALRNNNISFLGSCLMKPE